MKKMAKGADRIRRVARPGRAWPAVDSTSLPFHAHSGLATRGHRRRPNCRRGMSVLIVILLVSVTMAVSYSVLRSQSAAIHIQQNASRQGDARAAALTGVAVAIKKMHASGWVGVNTTLAQSLGSHERFEATFTAGDASLAVGSSDYADYPYRVTILSTGHAEDPDNTARVSTHRIRVVVRLVPRAMAAEPSDWTRMQAYTVYQTKFDTFQVDLPCRIEGPVRVQGVLRFAKNYPPSNTNPWWRYIQDLNSMRNVVSGDYRPFNGPVHFASASQEWMYREALEHNLGVSLVETPLREAASDWVKPTAVATYRLYAGGPTYTIPTVGATLENTTLEPDTLTNPLGIYYCAGSVAVKCNVTVRGTLVCKDNISVEGTNVKFEPVALPSLYGSTNPLRLHVASCTDFVVKNTAGGSLTGLLAVFNDLRFVKSPVATTFAMAGRVVTRKLCIEERQSWETADWDGLYYRFMLQLGANSGTALAYFPVWMYPQGYNPQARITIKPDPAAVTYHWNNWNNPIYQPHADDGGLRWDMVKWTENP